MEEKFCCSRKLLKSWISEIAGDKSLDIVKCGGQIVIDIKMGLKDRSIRRYSSVLK